MALTFRGGVHVDENKNARKSPIEAFPAPKFVHIPMSQHIGAHAEPIVKVGDIVDKGQLIASSAAGLSCPIHSSISGKVTAIEHGQLQTGVKTDIIIIENDYENRLHENIRPFHKKINETSTEEIIDIIKNAGIAGLGGATFPTYAKIQSALGKVTTLIVNGAECEPYITANHRLMLEQPELIINGMKILMKVLGLKKGLVAIEDNKLNAAETITEAAKNSKMIEIKILKTKYPQGDERQLIYALTGKELPAGKLPADIGYIVFNTETCAAICRAFTEGMPLIDRIVTVDGDCIKTPKNLRAPIGTPVSALIEYCGLKNVPSKIIKGGAMMGIVAFDINTPVIKGTSAVLVFSDKKMNRYSSECIHCGRCVDSCPMHLMPLYLALFSQKEDMESCEKYDVMSCVECGCCQYICPASVPIVQFIKTAKGRILENRLKRQLLESAKESELTTTAATEYKGRAAAARQGHAHHGEDANKTANSEENEKKD